MEIASAAPDKTTADVKTLFSQRNLQVKFAPHSAEEDSAETPGRVDAGTEEDGTMLTRVSEAVAAAAAEDPLLSGSMRLEGVSDVRSPPPAPGTPAAGSPTAAEAEGGGQWAAGGPTSRSPSSTGGSSPKDEFSQRFKAEALKLTQAQEAHPPAKVPNPPKCDAIRVTARQASCHEPSPHDGWL